MRETPTITTTTHSHTGYSGGALLGGQAVGQLYGGDHTSMRQPISPLNLNWQAKNPDELIQNFAAQLGTNQQQPKANIVSNFRVVKVFIADPNENVPLEKRMIYRGEEKTTDLTDQELFFEVPMQDLLGKHNEYRRSLVDRKQAEKFGRDILLEPVKIRDLRMVVVTVASF